MKPSASASAEAATPMATLTVHAVTPRTLRTLVVPVGLAAHAAGASDAAALQCAALLARTSGARVVLVHVFSVPQDWYRWEPGASQAEALVREAQEKAEGRLVHAAQALLYEGVPTEVVAVRRVDVVDGIVDTAKDAGASLLVMGTRGLADSRDGTSVTERVVTRAPCGVVAVYQAGDDVPASDRPPLGSIDRLLLVTGAEDRARTGGRLAVSLSAQHEARLDVAVLTPPSSCAVGVLEVEAADVKAAEVGGPARREWLIERLAVLLAPEDVASEEGTAASRSGEHLVEADVFEAAEPTDVLRVAAARRPDLLVLAGVPDEPLGALARSLAAQASCTVFVHEPKG